MRPDLPSEQDPAESGNVVDPEVFQQRRIGHSGPESLLARASAAERAVVALEGRLQEIERELGATARQRDELANELRQHNAVSAPATPAPGVTRSPVDRSPLEHLEQLTRARADRLEARLAAVDQVLTALGARLRSEAHARALAEAALVAQRSEHDSQVGLLRDAFAADSEAARARLDAMERELALLGESAVGLQRDRDAARAELLQANAQLAARESELSQVRGDRGATDEQLRALRAELAETRAALDSAREAQTAAETTATEGQLARQRAETELEHERVTFAQQIQIADGQLRAEIEIQRRAFDDHAAAVQRAIATLHEQLIEAKRATAPAPVVPPIDSLQADLDQAALRLRELAREHDEGEQEPVVEALGDPEPVDPIALQAQADDLARVIEDAAGHSAAEPAPLPLPPRQIPEEAVTAWMAPAFERLYSQEPEAAAKVMVDLLPALVADLGRDGLFDFAVDELGAFRLTAYMGTGSISSWRTGAARKADLALAGSALALSPFAFGGTGRTRPRGVDFSGKRRMLWKLLRARRQPVALEDIKAAGVAPGLGNLLSLIASNVDPDWVSGERAAVGFTTTGSGAGSWVVRADAEGKLQVSSGLTECDAVIAVVPEQIIALFSGGQGAQLATVTGDVGKALMMLGWFDRAQRTLPADD